MKRYKKPIDYFSKTLIKKEAILWVVFKN
jgi:hypothetical protein